MRLLGVAIAFLCFTLGTCDSFNFVTLGDWGKVNSEQAAVAKQLGIAAANYNATFMISLGDNFYESGVESDTDPQWQTTYRDVFTAPSLQIPWYAILGNHDHTNGRGQGQIDYYLNKRDNRWYLPNYWYNRNFSFTDAASGSNVTMEIVFIDTVIMSPKQTYAHLLDRVSKGELPESALEEHKNWQYVANLASDVQLTWLKQTLEASQADWLIVAGHYPVFSAGDHGNTPELLTVLKPMLDQYNVDAYLCGHDHTLQHLASEEVNYWVSGNGAKDGKLVFKPPQQVFAVVDPSFMVHQVTRDDMTVRIVNKHGKEIYNFVQKPRRTKH